MTPSLFNVINQSDIWECFNLTSKVARFVSLTEGLAIYGLGWCVVTFYMTKSVLLRGALLLAALQWFRKWKVFSLRSMWCSNMVGFLQLHLKTTLYQASVSSTTDIYIHFPPWEPTFVKRAFHRVIHRWHCFSLKNIQQRDWWLNFSSLGINLANFNYMWTFYMLKFHLLEFSLNVF